MCWPLVRVHFDVVPYFQVPAYDGPTLSPVAPTCYVASITFISQPYKWRITTRRGWRRVCDVSYRDSCSERGLLSSRVHSVLEKSLKMLEFGIKTSRPLKVLENRWGVWKYLKILEKSLNLNLANFEILHYLIILRQALVCMSPELGNSIWFHFACFSFTLQFKFWMSACRIWLFVNNFGAWIMQFESLKVLEKCLNFFTLSLLRTLF